MLAEILQDTVVGNAPVDTAAATGMVARLRGRPLLTGYRGGPPRDIPALTAAVSAIAQLVADAGDLLSALDINPLLVAPEGAGVTALDALVVLQ